MKLLLGLYEQQRTNFTKDPAGAAKLIKIGERKPDASLPPVELAAMTEVAQAILSADATVWKR